MDSQTKEALFSTLIMVIREALMDHQRNLSELIDEILNDPDSRPKEAILLLPRRIHAARIILDDVMTRMKAYASCDQLAHNDALLRDMHDVVLAVHDFAMLDARGLSPSVTPERRDDAAAIAERCETALARMQALMQTL